MKRPKRVRLETFPRACVWFEAQALRNEMKMGGWRQQWSRSMQGYTLIIFERKAKQ